MFRGLEGERQGAPGLEVLRRAGEQRHRAKGGTSLALHCLHASVQYCSISGFRGSVEVSQQESEVSMQHCEVTVSWGQRPAMIVRGKVSVEDCVFRSTVTESEMVCGFVAVATATCAVRRCSFEAFSHAALQTQGDASVAICESAVAGPGLCGIVVHNKSQVVAHDCRILDTEVAVKITGSGGVFTAERALLQASCTNFRLEPAPPTGGRQIVTLTDSALIRANVGVWAGDAAADISLVNCRVVGCRRTCRGDRVGPCEGLDQGLHHLWL